MSRIKIKHFGPIQDGCLENDGWIEISKTTIFIGNQGSGKSTVAKLISTFTWIEKALVRGDYDKKWFERKNRLKNQFLNYHRLENYPTQKNGLWEDSEIEYEGEAYHIRYEKDTLFINEIPNNTFFSSTNYVRSCRKEFYCLCKKSKRIKTFI